MMKITLFFLAQIMSINAYTGWHSTISERCPGGQYMYRISGVYSNYHKDRAWAFKCTRGSSVVTSSCSWKTSLHAYNGELLYQCPYGVISGLYATYSKNAQDRKFAFYCCYTKQNVQYSCKWTSYVNTFQGYLWYQVPSGYFLTGAKSHHDKEKGDRKWRFLICQHK